jgi:type III restriction enzyme
VANLRSATAVEQILGRILRMPKAEKKTRPALNRAYAFVRSPNFFVAAEMLRDQLVKNAGFNQKEAREFFVPRERQQGLDYDAKGRHCVTMKLQEDFQMEALPPAVRAYVTKHDAQKREVTLTGRPTRAAVEAMLGAVEKEESKEIIRAAAAELAQQDRIMSSPAERGERFAVPQMMLEFKGQIISPDDAAWLQVGWHLPLPPTERDLPTLESGQPSESVGIVDVEGGKVITRRMPELAKELQLIEVLENWTQSRLVSWLDRNIPHPKLELDEFRAYLDGVLTGLQIKLTLGRLVRERFELRRKIEIRIKELEGQAQRQGYQQALFGADSQTRVRVGGDYVFNYDPTNYPYREVCRRSKEFIKHYYEQVGDLDDEANREEFQCAQLIDGQEGVEWWVRNLERQPSHSFWLQTSTDKFYPDFVCKLKNEKTLVVEYKGAQLAYTPDTNEKERLGNLWAERSEGQALFRMIRTTKEFERVVEAARIN